ncbi:MAG: type II secretion system protein GspG [Acidobacteriota bacterium]
MKPLHHRLVLLSLLALLGLACGESGQSYADNVIDASRRGQASGARGDLQVLSVAVTTYMTNEGDLPVAGDIHQLADILSPTYVRHVKTKDPWGNDYDYWSQGSDFTLSSSGHDGEWDTDDDVVIENGQVTSFPKSRVDG